MPKQDQIGFLPEHYRVLGVKVSPVTTEELHGYINSIIRENQKSLILNVNVHCMNLAYKSSWLRDFLNSAELVFCDGYGVILGARLLGFNIMERITYADWIWQLAELAESRKFSFFFLGARPGVAERAAAQLKTCYPRLKIVGVYHGYFDKMHGSLENEIVIQQINAVKPNILVLGFGMPMQERWLMENWEHIDANIALTGGAVFDYVSGELRRASRWMTNSGLEWLGRLIIEPRRLWKRYLIGNPIFLWRILNQKIGLIKF